MASKKSILNSKWSQVKAGNGANATRRSSAKKLRDRLGIKMTNGKKSKGASSGSSKAKKKPTKASASQAASAGANKKAKKVSTGSAPKKKFQRNRPVVGSNKSPTAKYGTGKMVGGRWKFGKGLNKRSKWNDIVGKNQSKSKRGNQWHSDKDLKAIKQAIADHADEFWGKNGQKGLYHQLLNNPNAYNKTAHTLNLAMNPTVKGWIDDAIKPTSSHTKRFSDNFKKEGFDLHNRKDPKSMKRRAKAMFYTVQFGPDGKAK